MVDVRECLSVDKLVTNTGASPALLDLLMVQQLRTTSCGSTVLGDLAGLDSFDGHLGNADSGKFLRGFGSNGSNKLNKLRKTSISLLICF